eukprot:CAMPEP_0206562042 /NCGR_PEP_ID=MMETSP0325_2-20121206/21989_1 /ASSEMBLY_ACC=CAM_ASM_000347 /TAXON_ID=2866 /ORGANISM="Crypthecodinium cohnii, Strain Seligo" /LENGTH=632 /DNA_ID=CAMNT_0054064129 /DNA_START=86 /DNA_END=1981 /DNA_ORIENTATION=-
MFDPNAVDVPCRILLGRSLAELVAGPREEEVRRVRAESGANVQVLSKTLPAAFLARDECFVVIKCDDSRQLRAAVVGTLHRAFGVPRHERDDESKSRTVEVMIPEVACRHLVGSRGDRIKLLREEAGCDIQLSPGLVAGLAAQKRVRCSGRLEGVEEAVARIHEVLVEFAAIGILHPRHFDLREVVSVPGGAAGVLRDSAGPSSKNSRVPVRLLVSRDECAWLIGKRGNKIHKLRELAMVSTRDAELELQPTSSTTSSSSTRLPSITREVGVGGDAAGGGGNGDSVVDIFGAPLHKELCVLQLIVDDLAMMRDAVSWTRLVVASEFGRAHLTPEVLMKVELETKAHVAITSHGPTWQVLYLEGSEKTRLAAAAALHECLEAGVAGATTTSTTSASAAAGTSTRVEAASNSAGSGVTQPWAASVGSSHHSDCTNCFEAPPEHAAQEQRQQQQQQQHHQQQQRQQRQQQQQQQHLQDQQHDHHQQQHHQGQQVQQMPHQHEQLQQHNQLQQQQQQRIMQTQHSGESSSSGNATSNGISVEAKAASCATAAAVAAPPTSAAAATATATTPHWHDIAGKRAANGMHLLLVDRARRLADSAASLGGVTIECCLSGGTSDGCNPDAIVSIYGPPADAA